MNTLNRRTLFTSVIASVVSLLPFKSLKAAFIPRTYLIPSTGQVVLSKETYAELHRQLSEASIQIHNLKAALGIVPPGYYCSSYQITEQLDSKGMKVLTIYRELEK